MYGDGGGEGRAVSSFLGMTVGKRVYAVANSGGEKNDISRSFCVSLCVIPMPCSVSSVSNLIDDDDVGDVDVDDSGSMMEWKKDELPHLDRSCDGHMILPCPVT